MAAAGTMTLQLDDSARSKMVAHALALLEATQRPSIEVQTNAKEGPRLSTPEGVIEGAGAICRHLAAAAGEGTSKRLLGDSAESRAEVWQWLSQSNTFLNMQVAVPGRLLALNLYLQPRAVLVGSGTSISLADVAAYSSLHSALSALSEAEKEGLFNLMRWVDYIQNGADLGKVYKKIDVRKPKFAPPVPAPPTANAAAKAPAQAVTQAGTPSSSEPKQTAADSAAQGQAAGAPKATCLNDKPNDKQKEKGSTDEKEKKAKPPAQKKEVDTGVQVLDIRVGKITKAWKHPNADALYVEEIELGEGKPRQVVSGLAKFVPEAEMQGRLVAVLLNVKPGKVRDVMSEGLVLCASNADHTEVEPLVVPAGAKVGEKITFPGHEGEPEAVLNPKKKQFEALQLHLKTSDSGVAKYQDVPFTTSAGPCTSRLTGASIK